MDKIRIINTKNENIYFDIPWEWLSRGTQGPTLNDLESKVSRSSYKAKLTRVRAGEVPAGTLDIDVQLTQKELFPLFQLIRKTEVYIIYFEKYKNEYVKIKAYLKKINPPILEMPIDNNTDNILYDKFKIEIAGYEGLDFND